MQEVVLSSGVSYSDFLYCMKCDWIWSNVILVNLPQFPRIALIRTFLRPAHVSNTSAKVKIVHL